jgi:hypothetical protein
MKFGQFASFWSSLLHWMYSLCDPLQDIRPDIAVSPKGLENVPNKSAATLNTKLEELPLLQFFHFFHHLIWHMLCPSTVLPTFFLEVNAWNVCLFLALMLALLSKTVLCHAQFAVANLRGILRMLFFKYRLCVQLSLPIRRRKTKCAG